MREILFKAKDIKTDKWVFGHYYFDLNDGHVITYPRHYGGDGRTEPPSDYQEQSMIDPETLCQYTGLKDIYGNKIFEDDTCKDQYNGVVFKFNWRGTGHATSNLGNKLSTENSTRLKVTGNIHD